MIFQLLRPRLDPAAHEFLARSVSEIAGGLPGRLPQLISLASRHVKRRPLHLSADELAQAARFLPGWNPEHWNLLDAVRVALVLARTDLHAPSFADALEDCFRYADEGELCALYRSLALLPDGGRFRWRAGEGCRSNLRSVFEAVACDSPYPALQLDDTAWRQLVLKAVFIDVPLTRVHGLQQRLSPELARMALDFADERRSAGRPVPPQLWLCVGPHGAQRLPEFTSPKG